MVMDQLIIFHKEKKSEEWEDDELPYFSNQTHFLILDLISI